jgi:glycosyltransferase involved in cell wall biosynthesis
LAGQMKILFDYQAFEMQKFGGISRYFYEILCRLNKEPSASWELPVQYSTNEYLKKIPGFENKIIARPDEYKAFLWGKKFKGKSRLYNIKNKFFPTPNLDDFNQKLSIDEISKGNFDIFHPSYYDNYFLKYIGHKPYVITVYDMIHEIYPEFYMDDPTLGIKQAILKNASMIIAISQNTKNDLMDLFKIPDEKIEVIHLSSSMDTSVKAGDEGIHGALPEKYLLYVGNRPLYKNFYFFLSSILPILRQDRDIHILCTGLEFNEYEIRYFNNLNISDRVHHFYVDDASLSHLYKNALAFVLPSLYEGFGLPLLEAFSCGCPAIVSNTGSLPEVGGDAVIYFDPKNASSITEAVAKVIYDKDLRKDLIAKGHSRLALFSWEKMYKQTMQVYHKVLSTH